METPDEFLKKVSRRAEKRMRILKGLAIVEKKLRMMDDDRKKEIFESLKITGERVRSVGSVVTHEKFELCQESNIVKGPNCDNQPKVEVVDLCESETSCDGHSFVDAKVPPPSSAPGQADDSGDDDEDDDDESEDDEDDDEDEDEDEDDDEDEEDDEDEDENENENEDEDEDEDVDVDEDDDKLSNNATDDVVVIDHIDGDRTPSDCMVLATYKRPVINAGEKVSGKPAKMKTDDDEIQFLGAFPKQNYYKQKRAKEVALPVKNNRMIMSKNLKDFFRKRFPLNGVEKPQQLPLVPFKRVSLQLEARTGRVDGNVYVDAPIALPSSGLRPIIIDGSNVAFVRSNCNFSCKRLEICINYFKEKGHKVTAFVPQFRLNNHRSDNPQLLRKLEQKGDVVLTPSKRVDGLNIVPYDDRFIVQTAVLKGGIIVTRDNYNDLLKENPAWAETIKYRTLAFTWVDHDILIFPKDPLGEFGPSLEEFLRFN